MNVVEVRSRVNDPDAAQRIVEQLVGERLAACAHVEPSATARYWWNGSVAADHEVEIRCITSEQRLDAMIDALRRAHPYELPAIMWAPVSTTSEYADWVRRETDQRT